MQSTHKFWAVLTARNELTTIQSVLSSHLKFVQFLLPTLFIFLVVLLVERLIRQPEQNLTKRNTDKLFCFCDWNENAAANTYYNMRNNELVWCMTGSRKRNEEWWDGVTETNDVWAMKTLSSSCFLLLSENVVCTIGWCWLWHHSCGMYRAS